MAVYEIEKKKATSAYEDDFSLPVQNRETPSAEEMEARRRRSAPFAYIYEEDEDIDGYGTHAPEPAPAEY